MSDEPQYTPEQEEEAFEAQRAAFMARVHAHYLPGKIYSRATRGTLADVRERVLKSNAKDITDLRVEDFALQAFADGAKLLGQRESEEFWKFSDSPHGRCIAMKPNRDGTFSARPGIIPPDVILIPDEIFAPKESSTNGKITATVVGRNAEQLSKAQKKLGFYEEADNALMDLASEDSPVERRKDGITVTIDNATITRSKNQIDIVPKSHAEIHDIRHLKPSEADTNTPDKQIQDLLVQSWENQTRFNTAFNELEVKLGLARNVNGNEVTYQVPGITDKSPTIDCKKGKSVDKLLDVLSDFEHKIGEKQAQRTQALEALERKGFKASYEINNGQVMLTLSNPNMEGWGERKAIMTPLCGTDKTNVPLSQRCLISDKGAVLIDEAIALSKQAEKALLERPANTAAILPAVAAPSANGIAAARIRPKSNGVPDKTDNGVIIPRWKDKIVPHSRSPLTASDPSLKSTGNGTHESDFSRPKDQVDILIDNSFLSALKTTRTDQKNWLDVLKMLQSLPNVNLITTSYVGDLEFAGLVPDHGNRGHCHFHIVDPRLERISRSAHEEFFKLAQRHAVDENGKTFPKPGQNNLYVWESEKQHELFFGLKDALSHHSCSPGEHEECLKQFRDRHGHEGELSLYDYTQSQQSTHPVIIIANDKGFAKRFHSDNPDRFENLTTKTGNGISVCSTKDFFDALNNAFGGNFVSEINKHGGHEIATGYRTFKQAFNRQRNDSELYDNSPFTYIQGRSTTTGAPEATLEDVIKLGIDLRNGHQSQPEGVALGNHTEQQSIRAGTTPGTSWTIQ